MISFENTRTSAAVSITFSKDNKSDGLDRVTETIYGGTKKKKERRKQKTKKKKLNEIHLYLLISFNFKD